MKHKIEELSQNLLSSIYTTVELKKTSQVLEALSQSSTFKSHAETIVNDPNLTDRIKKTQLLFLFKDIDIPILYSFFSDLFEKNEFWMFSADHFDYFDEFVRSFQMITEKIIIVNVVTAIDILGPDLQKLAKDMSDSFGTHVIINLQVNPGILGGAQVRVGNLVFDYSLRSKFHQFQRQWISQMAKTSALIGREDY